MQGGQDGHLHPHVPLRRAQAIVVAVGGAGARQCSVAHRSFVRVSAPRDFDVLVMCPATQDRASTSAPHKLAQQQPHAWLGTKRAAYVSAASCARSKIIVSSLGAALLKGCGIADRCRVCMLSASTWSCQ